MLKNSENNGTEEIGLVTPTPVATRLGLCGSVGWSDTVSCGAIHQICIPVKLPWIFLAAQLIFNGVPGNIQSNLTGMDMTNLNNLKNIFTK